jgi:Mg-chelatase subunit ChlD
MIYRLSAILIITILCVCSHAAAQEAESKKDIPTTEKAFVGLVIDCSGSQRLQMDRIIVAVTELTKGLNDSDQAFLVRFIDAAKISVAQELTSSMPDIVDAAEGLYVEGGTTAVIDGVDVAGRYMSRNLPETSANGVLVLISDGDDRGSGRKAEDVIAALKQKNVRVFSIGISDLKVSTKLLDRFAKETGGKSYTPRNAAELSHAVTDILKFIHGGNASK